MSRNHLESLIADFLDCTPAFGGDSKRIKEVQNRILTEAHRVFLEKNQRYRELNSATKPDLSDKINLDTGSIPLIPSDFFKYLSDEGPEKESHLILQSSGTSQNISKVNVDKFNALNQKIALSRIVQHFLGGERIPMVALRSSNKGISRGRMSTSDAGVLGFSLLASQLYMIDVNSEDAPLQIRKAMSQIGNRRFMLFGFTFQVYEALVSGVIPSGNYNNMIVVHGGGWKKLKHLQISSTSFREMIADKWGAAKVHDYYGMAEQTGSIFFQCNSFRYHVSNYSNLFVRDRFLNLVQDQQVGVLHVVSFIQSSYPGQSIVTQDLGFKESSDGPPCPCGTPGMTFFINGRLDQAEIKGCSDAN